MSTCPISEPQTPGHCHWCGKKLKGRQTRWCSRACARTATAEHRWTQAKAAALDAAAHYQCEVCAGWYTRREVEVNHIVPCKGKHGVWGCHHHQENLQVLCKPCHKDVTAEQRKRGWT